MERETLTKSMKEAISNVLETMFYLPVQFVENNFTLLEWFTHAQSLLGATLSFHGPATGRISLLIPVNILKEITANFLGLNEGEINEEQKRDTVKEILNMIGGHMLSLVDKGGLFKIGLPEAIDEDDLSDHKLGEIKGEIILIETEDNHLAAGIAFE